ncbi:hypothetical protein TNCV_3419401 [Trichonephila clavipes]|nr:hypothetical protein TNCV_3419401 [Trichonephila clavipes]
MSPNPPSRRATAEALSPVGMMRNLVSPTSRYRLDDSFRWRAVGRLEVGQSQVEVTRWLAKATTEQQSLQRNGYLELSARRNKRATDPQLDRVLAAVSGRKIS